MRRTTPWFARLVGMLALAALPPTHALAAQATPAMWEVSDSDSKLYLFGSIHALPAGVEWRTPIFDAALNGAPEVYFETDIGPLGLTALTFKMIGAAIQSARSPWIWRLTSHQQDELTTAIEPLGLTLDQADRMPPWLIAMQVAMQSDGADGKIDTTEMTNGVDWTLQWSLPKERKAYLETPGQQFDLLAGDPIEVQVAGLINVIETTDVSGPTLAGITTAWEAGDVDALVAQPSGDDEDTKRLLYDRNRNWIPKLEQLLKDNQEDLIVVGAAHLAGPGSVLDLLAKDGFTVTRIQ